MKRRNFFKKIFGGAVALAGFFASLVAVGALFTGDLPSHKYYLDCSAPLESKDGFWQTQDDISRFYDFAAVNDGRVVYLNLEVHPSSQAGSCRLADGATWNEGGDSVKTSYSLKYTDSELLDERFDLEPEQEQEIKDFVDGKSFVGAAGARIGIESEVNQESYRYTPKGDGKIYPPEWIYIHLPDPEKISGNGVYRTEKSPFWYFLDGPFVIRLIQHRSVAVVKISPLSESENYWREVECSRKRIEWPILRRFNPCW
ncbi:MAG: hypothetical protein ACK5LJ_13925 [Paracoccus sp. (in: a-proteobacteria)]